MAKETKDALSVISEINKKFGDGSIFKFSDKPNINVEAFSTGILGLDSALGVQGIARGKITEIIGQSGSGKTGICLSAIASAQKLGYKCAIVDTEHALALDYAELLGVNVEDLFVSQPDTGNDGLAIVKLLIESDQFALVIIDSIAALTPMQETDQEDFGSSNIGLHARLMSQAMRKLSPLVSKHNTALLMTNQLRANVGAMGHAEQWVPTGGQAVKFFSTVRIELKRMNQVKEGDSIVGHLMSAKVIKNKLAPPFKTCQYEITYGENSVKLNELIELGSKFGFITKGGSWYSYGDTKIGQGAAKVKNFLIENKDIAETIETAIKERLANE